MLPVRDVPPVWLISSCLLIWDTFPPLTGEISLELSIIGRSCTTCAGEIVGVLLSLFVISPIGVVDDIGVIVVDIDDSVTKLDIGISTDESGWLIVCKYSTSILKRLEYSNI